MFMRILINGLILSSTYALLAAGFSLIFSAARIFNMAHTALYMVAAISLYSGISFLGLSYALSAVMSIGVTILLGIICYVLLFDKVKVHETAVMIISIAVAMLLQEIFLLTIGGHYRGISLIVSGSVEILGIQVLYQRLIVILGCLVAFSILFAVLKKTSLGKAIRAVSQDIEVANLMGINVSRVSVITMGISSGLAALAAIVAAPLEPVQPAMWLSSLVTILAVVVLGGLGSVKGSIFGALILGFAETIVVTTIPTGSFLKGTVSLVAMIFVLIIKPEGLCGIVFEEERL